MLRRWMTKPLAVRRARRAGWRSIDITGERFGRVTVLGVAGYDESGHLTWAVVCDCHETPAFTLRGRRIRSPKPIYCRACAIRATQRRSTLHGHTPRAALRGNRGSSYRPWVSAIQRCTNPNTPNYDQYGGRGITICARWRDSFAAFLEDMGGRPSLAYSLDRYPDPNGNYEPGNCRWATSKQQQRNKRNTCWLVIGGVKASLADWAERYGQTTTRVHHRLQSGWTPERALTTPKLERGAKPHSATSPR